MVAFDLEFTVFGAVVRLDHWLHPVRQHRLPRDPPFAPQGPLRATAARSLLSPPPPPRRHFRTASACRTCQAPSGCRPQLRSKELKTGQAGRIALVTVVCRERAQLATFAVSCSATLGLLLQLVCLTALVWQWPPLAGACHSRISTAADPRRAPCLSSNTWNWMLIWRRRH